MSTVLVDTCVWSEVLRRKKSCDLKIHSKLRSLIEDGRVEIIGPIRQEILSGTKQKSQFEELKSILAAFDDTEIIPSDYETAAAFHNMCQSKGIQGSQIDYLICAVAFRLDMEIFTFDKDFTHYKKHLKIMLHN